VGVTDSPPSAPRPSRSSAPRAKQPSASWSTPSAPPISSPASLAPTGGASGSSSPKPGRCWA